DSTGHRSGVPHLAKAHSHGSASNPMATPSGRTRPALEVGSMFEPSRLERECLKPSVCPSRPGRASKSALRCPPGPACHCQEPSGRKEGSMNATPAALYARVSSEGHQEAKTIERQVADLRACIRGRGLQLAPELAFVDDGSSGATLVRPALERLRDVAAA